jgi:PIN like domain
MNFFFDKSVGKAVPTALRTSGVHLEIHDEVFDPNTSVDDETWIRYATSRDLIIVSRDRNIRRHPAERRAFVESRARMLLLGGKATRFEMLRVFLLAWPGIVRVVETHAAPWIYFIDENGHMHARYPEPPRRRRKR